MTTLPTRILFVKTKWEMWHDPLVPFLDRARADGFDATEIFLKTETAATEEIVALHRERGLDLVAQILTDGATPDDHIRSLEDQFEFAMACRPIRVNVHAGRDIFPFDENVRILARLIELGRAHEISVCAETHRGRATYAATATRQYLEALPELRLTADFSHWMVVHESDLSDQEETLELAISRTDHIHARVGYEEGPQVPDPRAPEWRGHAERHLEIWRRIVDLRDAEGRAADAAPRELDAPARELNAAAPTPLTIAPEFGPTPYMHTAPFKNEPVADPWELNVYMRDLLVETFSVR